MGLIGWIVVANGEHQLVRFLVGAPVAPRPGYDILVDKNGRAGAVVEASDAALPDDQIARCLARNTAAADIGSWLRRPLQHRRAGRSRQRRLAGLAPGRDHRRQQGADDRAGLRVLEGVFLVAAPEYAGEHEGEASFALSLASAGEVTFAAL